MVPEPKVSPLNANHGGHFGTARLFEGRSFHEESLVGDEWPNGGSQLTLGRKRGRIQQLSNAGAAAD